MTPTDTLCTVDDCNLDRHGRQAWCKKHYTRWQRHGDPTHVERIHLDHETRFLSYVEPGPLARVPELGRCWTWTAYRSPQGYGMFSVRSVPIIAARWAYQHWVGDIPEGLQLDHFACDGGPEGCVNPYHVRPVTPRENVLRGDSVASEALAKTHCPQGHPYSGDNLYIYPTTGHRRCRACHREQQRRYQADRKANP